MTLLPLFRRTGVCYRDRVREDSERRIGLQSECVAETYVIKGLELLDDTVRILWPKSSEWCCSVVTILHPVVSPRASHRTVFTVTAFGNWIP